MKNSLRFLLVSLALTACAPFPAGTAVRAGGITVRGAIAVQPVGGKFGLLDVRRVPYTLDRLDRIEVVLEDLDGVEGPRNLGVLQAEGEAETGRTFPAIVLQNLRPARHYKVTLQAFQAVPGRNGDVVQVDDNADGGCETTFDTLHVPTDGASETIELGTGFNLQLADQDYTGTAGGTLAPAGGNLTDAQDAESIVLPNVGS